VVLPQPAVVQLQASGVLPASQPVIAVTGGTAPLHNHTVNTLLPAAGNGSTSGKMPVTKPLLQSTTPATGLDVSSDCVMIADNQSWKQFSVACMWDIMGEPGQFRVSGRQSCSWAHLIDFLTVNSEFSSLAKNGEGQLESCWPAWSCRQEKTVLIHFFFFFSFTCLLNCKLPMAGALLHTGRFDISDFGLVINQFSNPYNKNTPLEVDELEMSAVVLILFPSPLSP